MSSVKTAQIIGGHGGSSAPPQLTSGIEAARISHPRPPLRRRWTPYRRLRCAWARCPLPCKPAHDPFRLLRGGCCSRPQRRQPQSGKAARPSPCRCHRWRPSPGRTFGTNRQRAGISDAGPFSAPLPTGSSPNSCFRTLPTFGPRQRLAPARRRKRRCILPSCALVHSRIKSAGSAITPVPAPPPEPEAASRPTRRRSAPR